MTSSDFYLTEFKKAPKDGLEPLRRQAINRFAELGFPGGHEEGWRFTDLSSFKETAFPPAAGTANPNQFSGVARGPLKDCQIAFVDGRFAPAFSALELPPGVTVASLAAILKNDPQRIEPYLTRLARFDKNPFAALNTAFFADGAFVHLSKGVRLEQPLHLLFISSLHGKPYMTHPRVLVVAEEETKAILVESHLGPAGGTYFANVVTEILGKDGAEIEYAKVQRESHQAFHFAAIQARMGRNARFTSHSISLGARLSRNDLGALLDGEGAECALNGLYEVAGDQLADSHTTIDHARPHTTSRELYKGVLSGKARGVFDGRIIVRPDAQKTNAVQTNKNLLLSKDAMVNTKPQLEIFANDVKCKHGATIGQLDGDVLFYLRSRGIAHEDARRLLIHAFVSEVLDRVKIPSIHLQLGGCLGIMS